MQIDEALKQYLKEASFAVVSAVLDLGSGPETLLLVKATGDLVSALKEKNAPVRVGWLVEATEAGPVTCLVLAVGEAGAGEIAGDAYFDVGDERDREALALLSRQERLKVGFFDEEMALGWLADARFGELDRLAAEQAQDRAEDLWERAESLDEAAALRLFQARWPLDRLVEKAITDVP